MYTSFQLKLFIFWKMCASLLICIEWKWGYVIVNARQLHISNWMKDWYCFLRGNMLEITQLCGITNYLLELFCPIPYHEKNNIHFFCSKRQFYENVWAHAVNFKYFTSLGNDKKNHIRYKHRCIQSDHRNKRIWINT